MKIVVIGAGAMGSIYGGHLSTKNEVYIVESNRHIVDQINQQGLKIEENGVTNVYYPKAVTNTDAIGYVDLVILFVKSLFSREALEENKQIIGQDTRILTLQNGAGHENILMEFVPKEQVVIGTTEDNGTVLALGKVRRGGTGVTNIGMLVEDEENFLPWLKNVLDGCGFQTKIQENIQQLIWDKLMTNVSLSAVTGILQVDMGYIALNESAWRLTKALIHEAVEVASNMGLDFEEEKVVEKVKMTSLATPKGFTSIRADLRDGRKTEVDTISGAVIQAAKEYKIAVPYHEFVVTMIHAMEERNSMY